MHYYNALLDNSMLKNYKIKHNLLLFVSKFLYTNTKFWRFELIFRVKFRF